jgi:hypothetical protein
MGNDADSKCLTSVVTVRGVVLDAEDHPVEGAIVGVSWTERGEARAPVVALTQASGKFSVEFRFNSFVSYSGGEGHDCGGVLGAISVTVQNRKGDRERFVECVRGREDVDLATVVIGDRRHFEPLNSRACEG